MNNSRISNSNEDEDEEDQAIFKKLLNIHRAREKTQSYLSKRLQQKQFQVNKKKTDAAAVAEDNDNDDESDSLTSSCSGDESSEMKQETSKSSDLNASGCDAQNEEVLQVNCNSIIGELFKSKLGSGNKGSCIRVLTDSSENSAPKATNSSSEYKWFTPIEFESYCGKGNCRDWKKTIKVGGQPLLTLFESQALICHAVSCCCAICNQNESLVGPIRPFKTYRRRKKDEILAQNAYKKFLSLKPPTLFNHDHLSKLSANLEELSRSSRIPIRDENSKNFSPHSSSFISETEQIDDCIEKFDQTEEKRWNLLEQAANNLINQANNLKAQIEKAKEESRNQRFALVKRLISMNSDRQKASDYEEET